MYAIGAALRTTRTLYHASINVPAHERLTPEQRSQAINRLAFAPGLTGQPSASVEHEKRGGEGRRACTTKSSCGRARAGAGVRSCACSGRACPTTRIRRRPRSPRCGGRGITASRDGPNGERVMRLARAPSHAELQRAAFATALEQHGHVLARKTGAPAWRS